MRIVLLVSGLLVLCSSRFSTDGRSALKEVQHLKGIKSNLDDKVDLNEPWPFKNTLSKTDPSIAELMVQIEF